MGKVSQMEEVMLLFSNYGFPMVVAGYLLVRLEPCIRGLERSISLLTLVVARQADMEVTAAGRILEEGRMDGAGRVM